MENINELLLYSYNKEEILSLKQRLVNLTKNWSICTHAENLLNKVRLMRAHILLWEIDEAKKISVSLQDKTYEMTPDVIYFYHKLNGNIAYARKDNEMALLLYLQAYEVIPDCTRNSLGGLEVADLHYSICLAAHQTVHLDIVEEHFSQALQIYEKNKNFKRVSELYTVLSVVEEKQQNHSRSLKCLERALYYGRSTDSWKVRFPALFNYAHACMKFNKRDKCIENCEIGIENMPEDMKFRKAMLYILKAKAHRDNENMELAKESILKAGEIIKTLEEHEKPMLLFEDFYAEYKVTYLHILNQSEEYEQFMKSDFLPRTERLGNDYDIRYYYQQLNSFYIKSNNIEGIMSIILKVNELVCPADSELSTLSNSEYHV